MKKIFFVLISLLFACTNEKNAVPISSTELLAKNNTVDKELETYFVSLKKHVSNVQLDLRYFGTNNFIGKRIDGYHSEKAYLSKEAADSLQAVQSELKRYDLGILVYDAYRPQRAVDHFVRWAKDKNDTLMKKTYYPDVAKKALFKEDYIAARSGHSRGSTVDLTIIDLKTGKALDMGSNYDFFGKISWPSCRDISKAQYDNRMKLQGIMTKHGFVSYAKEWWHFTLKKEPFPERYFDFVIE